MRNANIREVTGSTLKSWYEETCRECDTQIKYTVEKGKTVVMCPNCGTLNPLCGECTRPERKMNACNRCALVADCERMTALLAKGRK